MKKWKLIAGVTLVMLVGVLAGSIATTFFQRYRFERPRRDPVAKQAVLMERLTKKLDLTEDQQRKFRTIIVHLEKERREHFRESRQRLKKIRDDGYARMKQELQPEQVLRFEKMVDTVKKRILVEGIERRR